MAKHSKIDMGPATENLPEWSISSEISTEELIKKEAAPNRENIAEMALDSAEFVLDGTISSPGKASRPVADSSDVLISPQRDFRSNDGMLDLSHERVKTERSSQFLDGTPVPDVSPKEAQKPVAAAAENDEVEERLGYLANSLKDWEQSENALSEAAAMLLNISAGHGEDEKDDIQSLRRGLDNITASIHRMSASAREDMADVIEQTQRDNELLEAIQAETAEVERTVKMDIPESLHINTPEAADTLQIKTPNVADTIKIKTPDVGDAIKIKTPDTTDTIQIKTPVAADTMQIRTPGAFDESESGGMNIDQILEQYHTTIPKTTVQSVHRESVAVEQPAVSRPVVIKTLAPLDETETSGMNVNGIAELHKKSESRQMKETKKESERKHAKASKNESERKLAKASKKQAERKHLKTADHEFETFVIPEGEESGDGFHFVVDKGIVENPVEWRIDSSFQSGSPQAEYASAAEDDKEVFTVSGIEDQLKKQEVEAKRSRVEKSRLEASSGFAYALSDLK